MTERDRDRFSLIGHAALPFMCPLEEGELTELLAPAALTPGDRTLDLGGGRGDLACLLARRFGCEATSVDRSAQASEAARARAAGLTVRVEQADARAHLQRAEAGGEPLALLSLVGAIHCFGTGRQGWARALEAVAPRARRLLVGDLAATTPRAAEAFEVALLDELDLPGGAGREEVLASLVLGPERVLAYERAWCASVAAHVAAHPDDPRSAWARQRIAWTDEPSLREARAELVFAVFLL